MRKHTNLTMSIGSFNSDHCDITAKRFSFMMIEFAHNSAHTFFTIICLNIKRKNSKSIEYDYWREKKTMYKPTKLRPVINKISICINWVWLWQIVFHQFHDGKKLWFISVVHIFDFWRFVILFNVLQINTLLFFVRFWRYLLMCKILRGHCLSEKFWESE